MMTIDDLVFAFTNKLACRHVSSAEAFHRDISSNVQGDAYAIGAVNLLTFPTNKRTHDAHDALMERIIASFSGGPQEVDIILSGGEKLIQQYKSELRRMVAAAVDYDDRHGNAANCHFILYKDIGGVSSPYDINKYPFGKCGKDTLHNNKVVAGVFLEEDEKVALQGNALAITDRLTEKLLSAISRSRTRAGFSADETGEISRGSERTDPKPRQGGWADNS